MIPSVIVQTILNHWKFKKNGLTLKIVKFYASDTKHMRHCELSLYTVYGGIKLSMFLMIHVLLGCAKSLESCLTLYDPMDYSPPGSSVHEILHAGILEWVSISSSRVSPGIYPTSPPSPALAGGFSTTSHLGSPTIHVLHIVCIVHSIVPRTHMFVLYT